MVAALHLFTSVMARGRTCLLVSHQFWGLIYCKPSVDTDLVKSGCIVYRVGLPLVIVSLGFVLLVYDKSAFYSFTVSLLFRYNR